MSEKLRQCFQSLPFCGKLYQCLMHGIPDIFFLYLQLTPYRYEPDTKKGGKQQYDNYNLHRYFFPPLFIPSTLSKFLLASYCTK